MGECCLRACAQGTLIQRMCREYRGSGQPASDGHPECINQSSGRTCLCCGRGIACVSCMIEDPGIPSESLARKTTKAGGGAEEGPLETLVSLTRCCLRGRLVWRCREPRTHNLRCFSSNRYQQGDDEELAESSCRAPNAGTVTEFCRRCTWRDKTRQRRLPVVHPRRSYNAPTIGTDRPHEGEPAHAHADLVSPSSRNITRIGWPARQVVFKDEEVSSRFFFRLPRIACFSSARFVVCNACDL